MHPVDNYNRVRQAYTQPEYRPAVTIISKELVTKTCIQCMKSLPGRKQCPCLVKRTFKIYVPQTKKSKLAVPSPLLKPKINKMSISFLTG